MYFISVLDIIINITYQRNRRNGLTVTIGGDINGAQRAVPLIGQLAEHHVVHVPGEV